jgi:tryptophan synthase alpha chain
MRIPYTAAMNSAESQGAHRIRAAFDRARADRRCALLPFVTAGYPDLATTGRLLRELPSAGADLIEVGFPFSDPIADGPVIAESMHEALLGGTTPESIFELVRGMGGGSDGVACPLLAMVSVSIVERMGAERFIAEAVAAGFSGFIVPDADPTDAARLSALAAAHGAGFCALVAPSTPMDRARRLAEISTGFVYLLARVGVTGESSGAPEIELRAAALREVTKAPLAAGFGISTREHVEIVGRSADGAIVGSAIVRAMRDAKRAGADTALAALGVVRELADSATRA